MVHALYTGQKGTGIADMKGYRRFKYVSAAVYLSLYPKFMDLSKANSAEVSDDVRGTGKKRAQIDEDRMEWEKEKMNTDVGEEISKEITTEHTQVDGTEVLQLLRGG